MASRPIQFWRTKPPPLLLATVTISGNFPKPRTGDEGRGLIYLPPLSENSPIFCLSPFAKIPPVFLPEQTGRKKHRTPFPPSAAPTGITHYTLQAKSCAKGQAPLETPDNKTG